MAILKTLKIKVNAVERTMTEQRSAGLRFTDKHLKVEKPLQNLSVQSMLMQQ